MKKALSIGAAALLLVGAVACGDDGGSSNASGSGSGSVEEEGVVVINGTGALKFDPETITATKGQEFRGKFVQQGSIPHNIAIPEFGVKADDTLTTKDGDAKQFSFTPSKSGTFEFHCTIHPSMKGEVVIA